MKRIILLLCTTILLVSLILAGKVMSQSSGPVDTPENFEIVGSYAIWDAVDDASGYTLRWKREESPKYRRVRWSSRNISANATSYNLGELRAADNYTFRFEIQANGESDSGWSDLTTRLPVPPLRLPQPTNLRRLNNLKVAWNSIQAATRYRSRELKCGNEKSIREELRPEYYLDPSGNRILYVMQVRAFTRNSAFQPSSRWSQPLILCAADLVIPKE
ncbi:MAG: fibronectin type III domain-containing protein [Chloroflexi bacterium]|nr:fibronectin type III domain-containing protein [Chloroflexota bacterium]